jgi:hypothetical protein
MKENHGPVITGLLRNTPYAHHVETTISQPSANLP